MITNGAQSFTTEVEHFYKLVMGTAAQGYKLVFHHICCDEMKPCQYRRIILGSKRSHRGAMSLNGFGGARGTQIPESNVSLY